MIKRAIVFGATGGIGQEIVRELAAANWSIYIHYNVQEELAVELAKKMTQEFSNLDFIPFKLDIAKVENFDAIFADFLNVNALIFAQGITDYSLFAQQADSTIEQIFKVNLIQPLKIVKYFEPRLLNNLHSRIIFIGSVYGRSGSALEAVYSASKGGIAAFVNAYAKEVASTTMTVNVIAPGAVETPMTKDFSASELTELTSEIPVGRMAQPTDVSFWIKNLVDERADYLTGQTIYVTGGWLV